MKIDFQKWAAAVLLQDFNLISNQENLICKKTYVRSVLNPPSLLHFPKSLVQTRTSDFNFFNFGALPNFLHFN